MDTSAGKATTKEQKRKFRAEGHCYECKIQGHIAQDCPTKKTKVWSAEITKDQEEDKKKGVQAQSSYSVCYHLSKQINCLHWRVAVSATLSGIVFLTMPASFMTPASVKAPVAFPL